MRLTTVGLVCALFLLSFKGPCDNEKTPLNPTNPTPVPPVVTVKLEPPANVTGDGKNDFIINGTAAAYKVTVTGPAGSIGGPVELHGARDASPGQAASDVVLGTGATTVSGDRADITFTLRCAPAPPPIGGRAGTLAGPALDSGHGGRVCVAAGRVVTCKDDAVMVFARFAGVDSPVRSVLCIPSVGPTTGTL